jgi:hypothetical protein
MEAVRLARAAYGGALVAAPTAVVLAFGGDAADAGTMTTARILGGRHVVQAVLTGPDPGPVRRYGGALVDALHAATMFVFARGAEVGPGRKRPAYVDGSVAAAFCIVGLLAGRSREE